jgi:SAM-dependent methyltransferase
MLQTDGAIDRDALTYLDVGCGPGALALALRSRLGPLSRYVGFDVHEPSIRWCSRAFGGDRRFEFELASVSSPYGSRTGESALTYRFPLEDSEASAVLARSVFTHLLEPEAAHYLSEIRRVLAPDGRAFLSVFLFEGPGGRDEIPAFPFPNGTSQVRWRVGARPHAGVAYSREGFFELVRAGNLRVVELRPGFLPGRSPQLTGQDLIVLAPLA